MYSQISKSNYQKGGKLQYYNSLNRISKKTPKPYTIRAQNKTLWIIIYNKKEKRRRRLLILIPFPIIILSSKDKGAENSDQKEKCREIIFGKKNLKEEGERPGGD
ncbi:hypothetical protein V6Z12_1Z001000 [Gossypium hirsutum]